MQLSGRCAVLLLVSCIITVNAFMVASSWLMPSWQVLQRVEELESVLSLILSANSRPSEPIDVASESGIHIGMHGEQHKTRGEKRVSLSSILVPALQVQCFIVFTIIHSASHVALLQAVIAKIDTSRICSAGHSFGAATALLFSKANSSHV